MDTVDTPIKPFSKDKILVMLIAFNGFVALLSVVSVLFRLRTNDFKVPVQYVAYDGSVISSSQWYTLYSLAFFVVLGFVVSVILAHRFHKSSIIFSRGVLITQAVVAVISLLTINALLGLVSQI